LRGGFCLAKFELDLDLTDDGVDDLRVDAEVLFLLLDLTRAYPNEFFLLV